MLILLTNDDGYMSEKLLFTKRILSKFGDVIIVAPRKEQSAKSMSLTIGGFDVEKVDSSTYVVNGTPVDCINYAIIGLNIKPDLVVSGTNDGYNIGIDIKYSGTVGAAFQAQYFGFKSLAISSNRVGLIIVKKELENTLQYIFANDLLSDKYTLNVNFPKDEYGSSKGIVLAEVEYRIYSYNLETKGAFFHPRRGYLDDVYEVKPNTDIWAYKNGYTSITRISL